MYQYLWLDILPKITINVDLLSNSVDPTLTLTSICPVKSREPTINSTVPKIKRIIARPIDLSGTFGGGFTNCGHNKIIITDNNYVMFFWNVYLKNIDLVHSDKKACFAQL